MDRGAETMGVDRRCFLKWSATAGAWAISGPLLHVPGWPDGTLEASSGQTAAPGIRIVRTGCPSHNCGGRCLLKLHVRDGVIVRIETDDRPADTLEAPQLRACARGRAYRRRQYHPDRLLHPLKRTGKRGEGRFERITWDEALDRMAAELTRVKTKYGNSALFVPYGTGSYSQTNGRQTAQRLMNLFGGSLGHYNNYSWACMAAATATVYGTNITGNQRQDWVNAKYILMWGWNPSEMRDGTNTEYFLRAARDRGARIVCIDPRMTPSAVALADEWVPVRPGTDTAMMSAMAHVMITEGLYDAAFVRTHCAGFDATQMPPGLEREESYKDYVLGARDGTPKTPAWAERIAGVPRDTIARIAREYATRKPGMLYQGYGMQRRAYGEQVVRAGCALAALTGNVGISGGWASGMGFQAPDGGPLWNVFPTGSNPVKASIPTFLWTEAVTRGKELGPEHGVRGADRLDNDIKLIYAVASNAVINQHANINRTAKILQDERLVEFIAVQDNFLTPTARFADLVLPACTQFETWGVADGWKYGDEVFISPKVVEPPGEARERLPDLRRHRRDARLRAGLHGRPDRARLGGVVAHALQRGALPGRAVGRGVRGQQRRRPRRSRSQTPAVALADFRRDPVKNPLRTPSGKIEIFSAALHALGKPRRSRRFRSTSRSGRARSGPRRGRTRCRPSAIIRWRALTRRWKAWTGSRRPFRSGCSSTRSTRLRGASRTAIPSGSSTTGGRPACAAA